MIDKIIEMYQFRADKFTKELEKTKKQNRFVAYSRGIIFLLGTFLGIYFHNLGLVIIIPVFIIFVIPFFYLIKKSEVQHSDYKKD